MYVYVIFFLEKRDAASSSVLESMPGYFVRKETINITCRVGMKTTTKGTQYYTYVVDS